MKNLACRSFQRNNNYMKTLIQLLAFAVVSMLFACTTTTTDNSKSRAASGDTKIVYSGFTNDNTVLHNAVVSALQLRGWTVTDTGNPIKANINNRGQNAVLSITVSNGRLDIETKGSKLDSGDAYVPIRYVDYLHKTILKQLNSAK